jgi:uncharacterized protein (DUF2384 family)
MANTANDSIYDAGWAEKERLEALLGPVPRRTIERWERGEVRPSTGYILPDELATLSLEVFENPLGAWHYLTTSALGLQGRIPLEVAQTQAGLAEVMISLRRIDRGIAS